MKDLRERHGELQEESEERRRLITSLQDENKDLHQQLDEEGETSSEDNARCDISQPAHYFSNVRLFIYEYFWMT